MTEATLTVCFIVGLGLLSAAGWLVTPPLGLAVAGAALVAVPILYVRGRTVR